MLVDGCVHTLQERVLPELASRFARGQLYAVLDVLRNLRDLVEEKSSILVEEANAAAAAMSRAVAALGEGGEAARAAAAEIEAAAAAAPVAPPLARRTALNQVFVLALERTDALDDAVAQAARSALGGHLAAQAVRDVMLLKPSMLEEISRG
jgi:hypothetical protein